ncbi:MAG TPA: hypothetical protein PKW62_02210 [Chitinophagaceae bacterium]|nr:hypothetical protein [Chitinophagaceae bacterium]
MTPLYTSAVTKELVIAFAQQNIEFKKQSVYLQIIIGMSRKNKIWQDALIAFFDAPMYHAQNRFFNRN